MNIKETINNRDVVLILILIFLSRIFTYFFFEIKPLDTIDFYMQIFPLDYLHQDLLKTLINGHSQPFGYNLFIGIVLKIFNGNELDSIHFIHQINIFLTIIICILSLKISKLIFNISNIEKIFLILILSLNPFFIFWENFLLYAHLSCFFHFLLFYNFLFYFKNFKLITFVNIFLILTLLSFIHALYHPLLLILIFIVLQFINKRICKKEFISFTIFLIFSLAPLIKNYYLFNTFSNSSWLGFNWYATVHAIDHKYRDICDFSDVTDEDVDKISEKIEFQNNDLYKREFLVGSKSGFNNIGYISKSKICTKKTFDFVINNPKEWISNRIYYFLMSSGKFSIDYSSDSLMGWKKNFKILDTIQNKKNFKRARQFFLIAIKIIFLFFLIKIIFNSNVKQFYKNSLLIYLCIVIYVITISHFFNAWEQERFMYSFWILNIIFYNYIFMIVKKIINK